MANGLRDALDAAWGDFPTEDIGYDWLRYTGNARPSAAWVAAVTRHSRVTFIQETTSTRSQEGFLAGVYDCQFAEDRARAVHPNVESIAVVVSDGNSADRWDASEYARGWASVATIKFYFPYGAVPICRSFIDGDDSELDGDWVPETWGDGSLLQQVVGFSPVANTDLNRVLAPYYPTTPAPAPLPPKLEEDDGVISIKFTKDGPDCHLWVNEFGKVVFRPYSEGAPGKAVVIAARNGEDYRVIDNRPLVSQGFGTVIAYAAAGNREALVTPTGFGPIIDLI